MTASEYLASFLIPSRGHAERLAETITALRSAAIEPRAVHFVVRADDTDPATVEFLVAEDARQAGPIDGIIGPPTERERLFLYYNRMAKLARGRWVIPWTDRARLSRAWDVALDVTRADVALLPDASGAVALTREACARLGGVAPTERVASWIRAVAVAAEFSVAPVERAVARDYGLGGPLTPEEAAHAREHGERVRAAERKASP